MLVQHTASAGVGQVPSSQPCDPAWLRARPLQVAKLQAEAERLIAEARAEAQKKVADAKAAVAAECAKELAEAKAVSAAYGVVGCAC